MGEYIPASYLVATSSLTDEQLRRCYQDFARSLEFAAAAPTLVFERLVANIVECLKSVARDTPSEARPPAAPPSRSPSSPPYPPRGSSSSNAAISSPVIKCLRQPATGTFCTAEVLPTGTLIGASRFTTFPQPYAAPPRIVTGLRYIGTSTFKALRITSCARAITCSDFTICVDDYSGSSSIACASWLSVVPEDLDFQVGTFSTTASRPSNEGAREVSRRITFERPYAQPPQVSVWFSGFQFSPSGIPKAETRCDDVTSTGFLLFVSSHAEAMLISADVAWAACSHDRPNTWMGSFGISRPLPGTKSGLHDLWGSDSGFKEESTSVFLATNSIAANIMSNNTHLRISCLKLDTGGLSWNIDASPQLTQVGATFIVLG